MGYVIHLAVKCTRCRQTLVASVDGFSQGAFITAKGQLRGKMRGNKWVERNMGWGKRQAYCSSCADEGELTKKEAATISQQTTNCQSCERSSLSAAGKPVKCQAGHELGQSHCCDYSIWP